MADRLLVAFSTFPDAETAERISHELVTASHIECANVLPAITSLYQWQGKLERSTETLVIFKLPESKYAAFEQALKALHPYDTPEIVAVPVAHGLPAYLAWAGVGGS